MSDKTTPADLPTLIRDLRAAGIPWAPPDDSFHPFPFPVRVQTNLYVALGHLCVRSEGSFSSENIRLRRLQRRVSAALSRVSAFGARSPYAEWFPLARPPAAPVQQTPGAAPSTVPGCS